MSIGNKVKQCISCQAGCSLSDLEYSTSLKINLGFDELDLQELLLLLEETFEKTFSEEGYKDNNDTVGKLVSWVELTEGIKQGLKGNKISTNQSDILPIKVTTTATDLIKEVISLQQEHNLVLMFHGGEVFVNFENSGTEYRVSSQEELTTLIEASKVLQRFERKVNYND